MGIACGVRRAGEADLDLHRPPSRSRGHLSPGVRGAEALGKAGKETRSYIRHHGPQRAYDQQGAAHRRPDIGAADRGAQEELRGVRRYALRPQHQQRDAGHSTRHRARARSDEARSHDRLRGQPYLHSRGVRRSRFRYRHERGRARACDAVPEADPPQGVRGQGGRQRAATE